MWGQFLWAAPTANVCDQISYRAFTGDPFFEAAWYPAGPSRGQCANLHPGVRIPKVLSVEEAFPFFSPGPGDEIVLANVIYEGKSHVARVPLNSAVRVSFVKDFFRYPVAHGALLFEFDDGVEVRSQSIREMTKPRRAKYLLYGITGILPVGEKMSLEQAFWWADRRVLIARTLEAFPTMESFVKKEHPSRRLELFPLTLTSPQAVAILFAGLRRAARRGYRDFFSGLNLNCIHDTFQVIDIGLGFRTGSGAGAHQGEVAVNVSSAWQQFQTRIPFLVEPLLASRGLWRHGHSRVLVLREGTW